MKPTPFSARVCSAGSAHRGGLERCRPSSGRVRSWDPLAAEALSRVTFESTPRGQLLGSSASQCGAAARRVSGARKGQHALFYPETPEGTEPGAAAGRAALGADGLVLNALCRGTPAGFRLGRKSKRGVCPPMEEPTLGERVTEAAAVLGVRLTGGAPPSSPNPRKLQTRNHDPPGARRPWGRSLRRPPAQSVQGTPRIRLQGTSASARTPTDSCSHSFRLQCPRSWGWNPQKCQSWGPIFGDGVRSQLLTKLNSDGVFW